MNPINDPRMQDTVMASGEDPSWNTIHYRAGPDGKPIDNQTHSTVSSLLGSGFTRIRASDLTRVSDYVSIEVHSTPPSEGSTTTSEDGGDWEDVEPDEEAVVFKSLIDEKPFRSLAEMCSYDRNQWSFDLIALRKNLELDFLESIKLVNYVRAKAREAPHQKPEIQSKEVFAAEEHLKPVLEDDAVLFSLDDLDSQQENDISSTVTDAQKKEDGPSDIQQYIMRIAELEKALQMSREAFLNERKSSGDGAFGLPTARKRREDSDRWYFDSYSTRDIHEEMLKDTARTDAYRDFIYENKHLFDGKIVLDVGCGTGILSLMCARAGAKHVYAVDNSAIIDKAREIAYVNGMQDVVTCLRGMVEEITLPVEKVDIIVSEWMGYALLYEAMLDSVLFARDKWLARGGLMIPSEISLYMTLLADPELIVDKSDFWSDVYGFDMAVMRKGIFEGAMVEMASPSVIPSDLSSPDGCSKILHLDLHTTTITDLTFHRPFQLKLSREVDALDGFVIWFDTIFGRPQTNQRVVTLSTGPLAKRTHWQQVKLVIDRQGKAAERLVAGCIVQGSIEYSRPRNENRNLEITGEWYVTDMAEQGRQHWKIDY